MKGSCLCGTIRYQIDQLDGAIGHCHCLTCQKAHSAAFASTAGVLREHFRWLEGQDALNSYESSPGKLRHFCARCGSHLVAQRIGQPHVIVRVATLDNDPGVIAQHHIWTSHDRPWLASDGQAHYETWQPGR